MTPGGCCGPEPTRSGSTPPPSTAPSLVTELADEFGSQCVVVAIDARRRTDTGGDPAWEVFTHGGRTADRASTPWRGPSGARRSGPANCW